jgi:quercetin dioxygenase-like cupin family protein
MTLRAALHRWDDLPLDKVTEMVARKTIGGAAASITQAYYKKGALVPRHTHREEILVYVLQGALRFRLAGDDLTIREGDVIVIPPGLSHQAESLDDTFVLTFRTPMPVSPS